MEGLILTSLKTRSSIFFCFLLFQYLLNERFYLVNLRLSALLFPSCAPCVSKSLHICFNLQKNIFFLWFVDNWIIPMAWSSWPTSDLFVISYTNRSFTYNSNKVPGRSRHVYWKKTLLYFTLLFSDYLPADHHFPSEADA